MLRLIAGLILVMVLLSVAGCNTARGFGKDLQALGGYIESSSE